MSQQKGTIINDEKINELRLLELNTTKPKTNQLIAVAK